MMMMKLIFTAGLSNIGQRDDNDDKKSVIRRRRNAWVIKAGKRPKKGEANHM